MAASPLLSGALILDELVWIGRSLDVINESVTVSVIVFF